MKKAAKEQNLKADKGRKPKQKTRAHGEGCISQKADKSWVGYTRYKDPDTGDTKKHFVYGKTRPEVLAKKKEWEDDLKAGLLPSKKKVTVSDWLDTWLDTYKRNSVRQNTLEGYQRVVKGHLKPSLGSIILKDLRPEQIQKMINDKLSSGRLRNSGEDKEKGSALSPRMVEYIYSVLHMAIEQALKNQLVTRNVCDAVNKPKKDKHEFIPWTTEQTNLFLTMTKGSRLFPLYMVAWGSGLRRSEICGLQWTDIDFNKGTLTVRRSLVRVKSGYKFGDPKTKKSKRTIPVPEQVMKELKKWKTIQANDNMNWNGKFVDKNVDQRPGFNTLNMVFTDEGGEPLKPDYVTECFKRDIKKVVLPNKTKLPDIRFHDLRHGHATMLLELGEDITVISNRLGHSTITLTADTYSHVREKLQRDASSKLAQVLNIN